MYPDLQLVILEGRGANRFLRQWMARFDHACLLEVSSIPDHVACHRNRVFQWFRDQCQLPWLVLVDDDVVPLPETDELLRCPADVACARAWGKAGSELHPHALSLTCCKIHRRVIDSVQPPWFSFQFSPDGTRQVHCECEAFHDRLVQANFRCVQAGKVGHRFLTTVIPGDQGPQFLFDDQIRALF